MGADPRQIKRLIDFFIRVSATISG